MRPRLTRIVLCVSLLVIVSCTASPTAVVTPTASSLGIASPTSTVAPTLPPSSDQTLMIAAAERLWLQQALSSYALELHFFTLGTEIFVHLTVVDGTVIERTCQAGTMFDPTDKSQCARFFEAPEHYTVSGLFATARALNADFLRLTEGQPSNYTPTFTFHATQGYPLHLVWSLPEYAEWEVTTFTPNADP